MEKNTDVFFQTSDRPGLNLGSVLYRCVIYPESS